MKRLVKKDRKSGGFEVRLKIKGNVAELILLNSKEPDKLAYSSWIDKRDLSRQFFLRLEKLLAKQGILASEIGKVKFYCDSPYFLRKEKNLEIVELDSIGKCGFTAWQTGEIISRVMNFALDS